MKQNGKKIEKQYNQINQSKTDFVKTVSKEGLGATSTPSASGDHLPEQPATSTTSAFTSRTRKWSDIICYASRPK